MIVACSLKRRWITDGTRHRPERHNSQHVIALIVINPFLWIEPVAHLSERKVSARVKWISVTSRLSCRVFNPHFGTFGKYSEKFGFQKLNKCHFTSVHDYHVLCSIHTSEHSVNIRTNSAFGKIRPTDNFRFRTYAILHCMPESNSNFL